MAPYVFVLPFVLVFAAFSIYPMLFTLRLSFTNWHGTGSAQWVGLGNYIYLLTNDRFWASLGNSAVLWLLIIPAQLVIAVLAAVLLNDAKLRLRGFYRTAFIVPFVTPIVAIAQIWVVLFDTGDGAINGLLNLVGLPDVGWLTTSEWAAIRLRRPMTAPSRIVEWFAMTASAPMCAPWTTQLWATVAPGPMSTGIPGGACSTLQSWTFAPCRTMMGAKSARSTALNHTDAPASTWTSPTRVAVGAMKAPGSTVGDRPSNVNSGIV